MKKLFIILSFFTFFSVANAKNDSIPQAANWYFTAGQARKAEAARPIFRMIDNRITKVEEKANDNYNYGNQRADSIIAALTLQNTVLRDSISKQTLQRVTDKDSITTHDIIANRIYAYGGGGKASNIAFGYRTLINNISGENNIAIGRNTLFNNNSGFGNIGVGRQALVSNNAGFYNIAIGHTACASNVTGAENVAIGGTGTLFSNITGSDNVALGYKALQISTQSNNVAIGANCANTLTTGENNIAIGSNVQLDDPAVSYQLNIGNWIKGKNGKIAMPLIPVFASDADADADTTLVSGSLYRLTGSRTLYQKP
jgi:hypothetical protein